MLNPCRNCIVKANCTKECEPHNIFVKKAAMVVTFFTILTVSIIIGIVVLYFKFTILPIWIGSVILCHIIPNTSLEFSSMEIFLMGPFIIFMLIIAILTKKYIIIPSEYTRNKSKPLIQKILNFKVCDFKVWRA